MAHQETSPDPKAFYNDIMPTKAGADYEYARWGSNSLLSAQYQMMVDVLGRWVTPRARQARRVLEVGPGPGTWTKVLLSTNPGAQYTLVDISREMLSRARETLSAHTNVSFVESDFLALKVTEPYDFFFSSRAIEYMIDKEAVAQKVASLLVSGGHGAIITKMPKPLFDLIRGRGARAFHSSQIRPTDLRDFLEENGLVVERIRIATATVPLLGLATLNMLVYKLLRHIPLFFSFTIFAESYVIVFRKP